MSSLLFLIPLFTSSFVLLNGHEIQSRYCESITCVWTGVIDCKNVNRKIQIVSYEEQRKYCFKIVLGICNGRKREPHLVLQSTSCFYIALTFSQMCVCVYIYICVQNPNKSKDKGGRCGPKLMVLWIDGHRALDRVVLWESVTYK